MNRTVLASYVSMLAMCLPALAGEYAPAIPTGALVDPLLREVSGIAASPRHANRYWVHNDSGDGALLYAIDGRGHRLGTVAIDGVLALDWEDIAAFERDGKSYLLIGDIGDNLGLRGEYELLAVEEPELPNDGTTVHVRPAWRVRFAWTDGPHDAEALAVDAARGEAYIVPKFAEPPAAYRLLLRPTDDRLQTPEHFAEFTLPPNLPAKPKFRSTAFDLSPDGRRAVVLGYRSAWIYHRDDNESWSEAFTHPPEVVSVVAVHQPEAAAFERDSHTLIITGEGIGALIVDSTPRKP